MLGGVLAMRRLHDEQVVDVAGEAVGDLLGVGPPGSSASATITTSAAPYNTPACSARHFPAPIGLQVATSPAATSAFTSFSPSATKMVRRAAMAARTSGSRYSTRGVP